MSLTRRQFVRRAFWSAASLGLGGGAYAKLFEPHHVTVSHIPLALPGLPRGLDGLRVAHLTDLHRSALVSRRYLEHCIDVANRLAPDLIVFTGDYLTDDDSQPPATLVQECAATVGRARARYGVFASLGNHDHWFDAVLVTRLLEGEGVPVLRNQNTTLHINGSTLPIVGLGDLWTEGVNFRQAFAGVDGPSLVLMHNPDAFEHWPQPGAQMILAGHTHGGQVNLPLLGPRIVPSRYGQKYAQGLFRRGDSAMYVNRGLGVVWPGVRLNCPPEIALFHLHCVPLEAG